jgi:hypothetical protein
MSGIKVHDTPSRVAAEAGKVVVDGPDGVAVSLTPEAAVETGSRLISAAAVAHGDDAITRGRARSSTPIGAQSNVIKRERTSTKV